MEVKEAFHQLIDGIDDEKSLKAYYELVQHLNNGQTGELWNKLTNQQKDELLIAYEESYDDNNLLAHKTVKSEYSKWLSK